MIFSIMPRLPRFIHPPVAAAAALVFFLILKRERRAVARNLRRVSGKDGIVLQWKVYRVFYSFCDLMVSYCFVPKATDTQILEMLVESSVSSAKINQCLAAGKGLIMWTAHVGNWEFASRLLSIYGQVNVARVVEDNAAELTLRNLMTSDKIRTVDLKQGIPASLELLKALRRNEIVAMQGDRVYKGHSLDVPFFSQPTSFPAGPFVLSQVSGAPILPALVVRRGWLRYHALIGDPIAVPPQAETADDNAGLYQAMCQAVRFLEATLVTDHDQWMNFFEFWPSAPRH
jgi:KDO2-lipid IV(A) lauroyltransferase